MGRARANYRRPTRESRSSRFGLWRVTDSEPQGWRAAGGNASLLAYGVTPTDWISRAPAAVMVRCPLTVSFCRSILRRFLYFIRCPEGRFGSGRVAGLTSAPLRPCFFFFILYVQLCNQGCSGAATRWNGTPANIVGHRWNAKAEAFRQITSYSLG